MATNGTDFMDALKIGADRAGVKLPTWDEKRAPSAKNGNGAAPAATPKSSATASQTVFSLKSLLAQEIPPPRWAIPNLLPEGLIFLAGKPKLGKSWMALAFSMGIASGGRALGTYSVERGNVLYLALEDNPRRIQKRARKILGKDAVPEELEFATQWKRLDNGGVELIDDWLDAHPNARLVVIDTFAKVRPTSKRNGNAYDEDYGALEGLKKLADNYGVTILLIHHLRKMEAADPLDAINGTTGLAGGVDGAMILTRTRGQADAVLYVVGRDIEQDVSLAIKFDSVTAQWIAMGDAKQYMMSEERKRVIDAIRTAAKPLTPLEVSKITGDKHENLKVLMPKMVENGELDKVGYGKYNLPKSQNVEN